MYNYTYVTVFVKTDHSDQMLVFKHSLLDKSCGRINKIWYPSLEEAQLLVYQFTKYIATCD